MKISLEHLDNINLEEVLYSKAGINLRFKVHLYIIDGVLKTQSYLQVDEEIKDLAHRVRRMIYANCTEGNAHIAIEVFNDKIKGI